MTHPWIRALFDVVRKMEFSIADQLKKRVDAQPLTWDGKIQDHLTPEDWRAIDREISEQLDK
jgi:hypothetical protein